MVAAGVELFRSYGLDTIRSSNEFIRRMAEITGKPIRIERSEDSAMAQTTALWLEYPDFSKVLVRAKDRLYYQVRGMHHEFGHMVHGHPGCSGLLLDEALKRLVGDGIVRGRVLISDASSLLLSGNDHHEAEAEAMGELITRSLLRPTYLRDEQVFG